MIKELKATVHKILELYPNTRDNDKELIWKVWEEQCGQSMRVITFDEFMSFSSPESIRRCRQQLQNFHVNLRGASYDDRHKKREPAIRKEVQDEKWNEIEKINEKRLKEHSIAFQYVYNNEKISPENKKVLLADIAKMEKGENLFSTPCFPFDPNATLLCSMCDWNATGHGDIWISADNEESKL